MPNDGCSAPSRQAHAEFPTLYGVPIEIVDNLTSWQETSLKLMVVAPPPRIEAMAAAIKQAVGKRVTVVISQADRIEIIEPTIDKSWGLAALAAHFDIDQKRVWAVGDNRNDCEMLHWAGQGFAMGQAPPAVQACANHVLPSIEKAGLHALVPLLNSYSA